MLAYFRNYKLASYLVAFLVPLAIIGVVFIVTGVNVMTGIAGGLIWLVLMLVLMYVAGSAFGKKADEESEVMLAIYNENCDPEQFKERAQAPAKAIYEECFTRGATEVGAWFLAPYALACADLGLAEDAEMMEKALLENIREDVTADTRAGIQINAEPVTLRLHGPEAALDLLLKAQAELGADESVDNTSKFAYLNFEIPLLTALAEGNTDILLDRFDRVVRSESNPMRMRVLDADAAAAMCGALGDTAKQRTYLDFVVKNGNKLPVVEAAKETLRNLDQARANALHGASARDFAGRSWDGDEIAIAH